MCSELLRLDDGSAQPRENAREPLGSDQVADSRAEDRRTGMYGEVPLRVKPPLALPHFSGHVVQLTRMRFS